MMCKRFKEYFEDLYSVDTENWFTVNVFGFDSARMVNYILGRQLSGSEWKSSRVVRQQLRMRLL